MKTVLIAACVAASAARAAAAGAAVDLDHQSLRCGPVALEMAARWLENDALAGAIDGRFPENRMTNLKELSDCAADHGAHAALVRWSPESDLTGCAPAVIPLRPDSGRTHFVALLESRGDRAYVLDFPFKVRAVSLSRLWELGLWKGEALHIANEADALPVVVSPVLRWLWRAVLWAAVAVGLATLLRRAKAARLRPARGPRLMAPQRAAARPAFTVVELLVATAVVAIVVALILPSVQSAREAARRTQCANNMRQVALALQNFESLRGRYPAGNTGPRCDSGVPYGYLSPHAMILPQLDRAALYDQLVPCETNVGGGADPPQSVTNGHLIGEAVPAFVCPSDRVPAGGNSVRVSMGVTATRFETDGDHPGPPGEAGAFMGRGGLRSVHVTDGLSATVFLSERLAGDAAPDAYSPRRDVFFNGKVMILPRDAELGCRLNAGAEPEHLSHVGSTWVLAGYATTWFNQIAPPNGRLPDCAQGPGPGPWLSGSFAARSNHPGSVNAAAGDGAVRSVSSAIDLALWRAVATRSAADEVNQW